ncbi:MAG: FAD-dependent oxidoreductase [Deltaproteobacteria bacterium]|nr:FAD-dependent oxidoreductase [Deltaproteobacteria bacterium]
MKILVIGGGISGISAAKVALKFGHEVTIVEREDRPGGLMARIANCRVGFKTFFDEIKDEPRIRFFTGCNVVSSKKKDGAFIVELTNGKVIEAQKIIIATGLSLYEPEIKGKRIVSSLEYDTLIDQKNDIVPTDLEKIAFILCFGSRGRDYPLCSSVCCSYTLRQIKWTLMRKKPEITVFYNDLRFFGQEFFLEHLFRNSGVRFVRSNSRNIEEDSDSVRIRYFSEGKVKEERFNYVILTNALRPNPELIRLSKIFGFSLNEYGFVKENTPLCTDVKDIYACGGSLEPMNIKDSILTGFAAGYLASEDENQEKHKSKVYIIENQTLNLEKDSGSVFVFYLGTDDPYSKMFYEYFSSVFCRLATELKEKGKTVYIITKNLIIPAYGEIEYEEARRKGVVFIHLEENERLRINGKIVSIEGGRDLEVEADRVVTMEEMVDNLKDLEILCFFRSEPQLRWSPTKWNNERFHVGFARYPREKRWELREYYAALAEIVIESQSKNFPQVMEDRCSGCGSCKNSCLSGAIQLLSREVMLSVFGPYLKTKQPVAQINTSLCLGCGLCASTCPSQAIEFDTMKTSTDRLPVQENLL